MVDRLRTVRHILPALGALQPGAGTQSVEGTRPAGAVAGLQNTEAEARSRDHPGHQPVAAASRRTRAAQLDTLPETAPDTAYLRGRLSSQT